MWVVRAVAGAGVWGWASDRADVWVGIHKPSAF